MTPTFFDGVVDRPRLRQILDTTTAQICVVKAPSGSGKTTLLRGWAAGQAAAGHPVLWLSISGEADSSRAFWAQVAEAARRVGELSADVAARLVGRIALVDDVLDVVIDALRDRDQVTFVLDAYEKLGDAAAEVDDDLQRLVERLPSVRVVIGTRGRTRLCDEKLLLRGRTRLIDDRDLALTESEIAELLRLHLGSDDSGLARAAARETSGYALGVRALVLGLSRRGNVPVDGSQEWNDLVATDLSSELADESMARFVLLTSAPPYFDAELAGAISGRGDVDAVLAVLEREGFGRWVPYARRHAVFQYVDSVRDAFLHRLRRHDPTGYRGSVRESARWLFEYGDYEMAFQLAVEAEDYTLASRVYVDLVCAYPEIYFTGRLLGRLDALPTSVLTRYPVLALGLGLVRGFNPVLRGTAAEAYAMAARQHPEGVEVLGGPIDRFLLTSVRAVALRLCGRFQESARVSVEAIAELDSLPGEFDDASVEFVAMILRQLSFSLLQGSRFPAALTAMARSAGMTKVAATRNYAFSYLVGANGYLGDREATEDAGQAIDPAAWPREHEQSYLNVMTLAGEGFTRLDEFDFEAALDRVARVRRHSPISEFWPFVAAVELHARIGQGEALSAARWLEMRLADTPPPPGIGDNTATRYLTNLHAMAWLLAGRPSQAEPLLATESPRAPEIVPARLLELILTGRADQAPEQLAGWLRLPGHTNRTKAATLLLGAAAVLEHGDEKLATALARRAYDLYLAKGVRAQVLLAPAEHRRQLAELAREEGEPDLAAYLLDGVPDVVSLGGLPRLVRLSKRELVVLAALVDHASREEIAKVLTVSPNTVKTQLRSIYRKLGVTSREAAVRTAFEYHLLDGH
ncbi:LuxR C-terminal-related transcriptional regulator [Nocardioides sp.]|uniref:helix-turn-helix transcriptional regulator n=1 Tax=Nocardioides sp. TaxID=35761 RepID=UPI0039E29F3C